MVDGRDDPVYAAGFSGRVAPGQPHGSRPGLGDDILRKTRDDAPMKRFGRAEEIAELVLFMCSDRCEFMGPITSMSAAAAVSGDGAAMTWHAVRQAKIKIRENEEWTPNCKDTAAAA